MGTVTEMTKLTPKEKAVRRSLRKLSKRGNPSLQEISNDSGIPLSTVKRAILRLEALGYARRRAGIHRSLEAA